MNKTTNQRNQRQSGMDNPTLQEVLDHLPVTPGFEQRCEDAAKTAYRIVTLRKAHARRGFLPVAIGTYLERLTAKPLEELLPVLRKFGIEWPVRISMENSLGIGAFLKSIGLDPKETAALGRITFCEQFGAHFELPAAISYRGGALEMEDQDERIANALASAERKLNGDQRRELERIVLALRSSFEES